MVERCLGLVFHWQEMESCCCQLLSHNHSFFHTTKEGLIGDWNMVLGSPAIYSEIGMPLQRGEAVTFE